MTLIGWDIFALMGITISFLIINIIFMLSYLLNNEFLKSWSREEFFNVFITLIMFGSLLSLVNLDLFKDNITQSKSYVSSVFKNARNIQVSILSDMAFLTLSSSLSFIMNLSALQALAKGDTTDAKKNEAGAEAAASAPTDSSDPPKEGEGKSGDKGMDALGSVSAYISLSPILSPFLTSLSSMQVYSFVPVTMIKLHELLINFVYNDATRAGGIPILLAAGIFLRAFKFSRNAGNTILALFISLYFVLPVIYLFNQALINTVIYNGNLGSDVDSDFADNVGEGFTTRLIDLMSSEIKLASLGEVVAEDDSEANDEGVVTLGSKLYSRLSSKTGEDDKPGELYSFVVRFFIEGFILPYLAIIIALGTAREFAMSLGSNVDFSSLVRLI